MRTASIFTFVAMVVVGVMAGTNEPIADNELGLTAQSCARQYCTDKDGLLLWLNFAEKCDAVESKYIFSEETEAAVVSKKWSPSAVGSISSIMAVVGVIIGFVSGMGV
jgi:hypothetical protein